MPARTCPVCERPLPQPDAAPGKSFGPFCSARCKLVDLSKWLNEEYVVPGAVLGDGHAEDWEAVAPDDLPRH